MIGDMLVATVVILIVLIGYVFFTLRVHKRIDKARYMNEGRRKTHKKLIWILPFLGPMMIRDFWQEKDKPLRAHTKEKRKKKKGHFHENTGGIWG